MIPSNSHLKKQAEKFGAYYMSKTEYTDYLIKRIGAKENN